MNAVSFYRLYSSTQNLSNSKNMALDSAPRTTEILEISSINTNWEKSLNTYTDYFLSKKISAQNIAPYEKLRFYTGRSTRISASFVNDSGDSLRSISRHHEEPGETIVSD